MNIDTKTKTIGKFGKPLAWADLPPKSELLMVQTKAETTMRAASAQRTGEIRPVIVDGVLMYLNEDFVRAMIDSGAFIVVYAGTNIPWTSGGRNPTYPPRWV